MIKSGLVSQHRARFENGYPHQRDLHPRNETIRPGVQTMDMPILEKSVYAQPMKIMKSENGKLDIKRNPDAQVYYDQLFSNTLGPSDRFYLASLIDRIGRIGSTTNITYGTVLGGTDRPLDNMPRDEGGADGGTSEGGDDTPKNDPIEKRKNEVRDRLIALGVDLDTPIRSTVMNPSQSIDQQEMSAVDTVENALNELDAGGYREQESYVESDKSFVDTPTPAERTRYDVNSTPRNVKKAVSINGAKNRKKRRSKSSPGLEDYKGPAYTRVTPTNMKRRSQQPSDSNFVSNIEKSPKKS